MSQANAGDFPIDPQVTSGTALAEILNRFYNAANTQNSGATEPPTTYPGMFWYDTSVTPPVLKIRNAGNSGWVDFVDSIEIDPGDISGLGTMATVNSPAPIANGGTGATTAAQALVNLGVTTGYVKKTGDTMTGSLTAPNFMLDADTYFGGDANNTYLHFNPNKYLSFAIATGTVSLQGAAGASTLYNGSSGDAMFLRDLYALNGNMGLIGSDSARRYLRFASDNWRLEWITSNGYLQYVTNTGSLAWRVDGSGHVLVSGVNSALYHTSRGTGNIAYNVEGYADWGGGTLGRELMVANPGWNNIHIQALHVQGQWAGLRFSADGNGFCDFKLSSNPVRIEGATLVGTATYSDNTGSMSGRPANQWIHNNATAVRYIRNEGAGYFIGFIDGYGEVNWPVGPSDERLKANIAPTTQDSLAIINQLEFIKYNFKPIHYTKEDGSEDDFHIDDEHLHELGLRAQQAQAIDSELVSSIGTYLQLNPTEVALLALHGVKQLLARVAALEAA